MAIKNIIFDLGGVLLNIDYREPIIQFKKRGVMATDDWYTQKTQAVLFDELETGKISPEQFREHIRAQGNPHLTDEEIDSAWNSILKDFPEERIKLLYELKMKYRLFLLSNTNAIHLPECYRILETTFGKNPFFEIFDHCYYSHEMRKRKPDPEIFTTVLRDQGLAASETFFIDDSPQHVEGARKAGIQAHWLDIAETDVVKFFNEWKK